MLRRDPHITFPTLPRLITLSASLIQSGDHPFPHQHTRLNPTSPRHPAKLLDPLPRQPQPINLGPTRHTTPIIQLHVTRTLRMLSLDREPVEQLLVPLSHHRTSSPLLLTTGRARIRITQPALRRPRSRNMPQPTRWMFIRQHHHHQQPTSGNRIPDNPNRLTTTRLRITRNQRVRIQRRLDRRYRLNINRTGIPQRPTQMRRVRHINLIDRQLRHRNTVVHLLLHTLECITPFNSPPASGQPVSINRGVPASATTVAVPGTNPRWRVSTGAPWRDVQWHMGRAGELGCRCGLDDRPGALSMRRVHGTTMRMINEWL